MKTKHIISQGICLLVFTINIALAQEPTLVVQSGHSGYVTSIDISPNGRLLVSGAPDGVVKLWDIISGKLLRNLREHTDIVTSVVFNSDGSVAASGGFDGIVKLWDVTGGLLLRTLKPKTYLASPIKTIVFHPDGNVLISGGEGVCFWHVETGKLLGRWEKPKQVSSISVSPDGKVLAVAEGFSGAETSNDVTLWKMASGDLITRLEGHSQAVQHITFSPDGHLLASAGRDNTIRIWDVKKRVELQQLKGHVKPVYAVSFSPDSKLLASGSTDETVRLWKFSTGECLLVLKGKSRPDDLILRHPEYITLSNQQGGYIEVMDPAMLFTLLPNMTKIGNIALRTTFPSDRKSIRSISLGNPRQLLALAGLSNIMTCVRFSPDGKSIAGGSGDAIRIWDIESETEIKTLSGSSDIPSSVVFSSSNHLLATGHLDGRVHLWDLTAAKQVRVLSGHFTPVRTIAFSMDGKLLISGSDAGIVKLWDIKSGNEMSVFVGNMDQILTVAISPDAKYVASTSADGTTRIWNARSGREIIKRKMTIVGTPCRAPLAFFPDSKSIAVFNQLKKVVEILELQSCKVVQSLSVPKHSDVQHFKFSQDGRILVGVCSTTETQIVRIWDLRSGKEININSVPEAPIKAIVFHNMNTELLSVTEDRLVKIWNVADGSELQSYPASNGMANAVAISTEHDMLAMASPDGETAICDLKTGRLLVKLIVAKGNDYLIATSNNYYSASRGGITSVAFRVGSRVYPYVQFDLQLNQPHRVLQQLGSQRDDLIKMYKRAYEMRLRRMGVVTGRLNQNTPIPRVSIVGPPLPLSSEEKHITLRVRASDPQHLLNRLMIYVNDVPVHGVRGIDLSGVETYEIEKVIEIELSQGHNTIQVLTLNNLGIESLRETIDLYCKAPEKKPNLYVLAIGISEYADKKANLVYASKDAEDVAKLFESQKSRFEQTKIISLLDNEATQEKVLQLRQILTKSKVDDQVVILLAGHGVLNENFDYYFAPYDMDFDNLSTKGISYNELERLLDKIPARNKLLLMDTCHSGEFENEEIVATVKTEENESGLGTIRALTTNRNVIPITVKHSATADLLKVLFSDLRRGTGTTVIAASAGREFAYEDEKWKNGAFSYTIFEGLKLGIADSNFDRKVSVSELRDYVTNRVVELTANQQTPTSRRENMSRDYIIFELHELNDLTKPWARPRYPVNQATSIYSNEQQSTAKLTNGNQSKSFQPLPREKLTETQQNVSKVIDAFFEVVTHYDIKGLKSLWSEAALTHMSYAEAMRLHKTLWYEIEQLTPNIDLKGIDVVEVKIMRVHVFKNFARAWGAALIQGVDAQTGKEVDAPLAVLFGLRLVLEADCWKIVEYGHPQTLFAYDLVNADTSEMYTRLLQEDRDLIDLPFIQMFRRNALEQMEQHQFQNAHRLVDITIDCASLVDDKSILADAYIAKALICDSELKFDEALGNVKTAIPLFYEAGDKRAVDRALLNYGSFAKAAERLAMAVEVFESSYSMMLQNGDVDAVPLVLLAVAETWDEIGNRSKALGAYQQCLRNLDLSTQPQHVGRVLFGLIKQYYALGLYLEAVRMCEELRKFATRIGLSHDQKKQLDLWYKQLQKRVKAQN